MPANSNNQCSVLIQISPLGRLVTPIRAIPHDCSPQSAIPIHDSALYGLKEHKVVVVRGAGKERCGVDATFSEFLNVWSLLDIAEQLCHSRVRSAL